MSYKKVTFRRDSLSSWENGVMLDGDIILDRDFDRVFNAELGKTELEPGAKYKYHRHEVYAISTEHIAWVEDGESESVKLDCEEIADLEKLE